MNVFCWLGWYVPRSRYGPTAASAPCPKRGFGRTTWPSAASSRSPASHAYEPSATITRTLASSPSSSASHGAQVSRSSIVGLLAGGAQRTAAAM